MPPMHRPHGHHKRYYKADEVPDTLRSVAEKAQLYCDALEVSGIDSKIEIEQRFRGGDFKISVWVMNENGDVDKFLNFKYNGQVIGSVMGYVPSAYDGEPIHKAIERDKDMTFEVDGYIAKVQNECKEKGYEDIADAMKVLKMEQFRTSPERVQELNNIIDPFCADIDEYIDKAVLMPEKAMCGKNAVLLDKKEVFADEKDTDLQCILVTAMEFQRDQNALFAKEGKGGFVDVQIVDDGNPLTKPVVVVAIYDNERAVNKEQPSKMFHLKDNPLDFTLTGYKTTQFVLDNGELVKSDVKMDFEKYSTDVAKKAFDTQIKVMHELYDEEAKNTISDGYSVERNYDIVTFGKPNMSTKDVSDMVTQMTNLCYRCTSAMDKGNPDREKEIAIACVENNFTPLDFSFVKDMPFDKTANEMPQAEEVGFVTALALSNGDTAFIYNRSIAVGDKTIDLGDKPFVAVNEFGEDITQRLLATMDKVNTVDKCREEIIHTANEVATDKKNNYYGERAEQYITERLERAESGQKSPVQHHKQTGMDK